MLKKILLVLTILALIGCGTAAISPTTDIPEPRADGKIVYQNEQMGYEMLLPEAWNQYEYEINYQPNATEGGIAYEEDFFVQTDGRSRWILLILGKINVADWERGRALAAEPDFEYYAAPSYALGTEIARTDTDVYYEVYLRQDMSELMVELGDPMPDYQEDFRLLE